jgi:Putative porin
MVTVATAALPYGAAAQGSSEVRALQQERLDLRAEQAKVDARMEALQVRLDALTGAHMPDAAAGQLCCDPDDPNSSDVTLSNFDDDLQVSLDQAWLKATFGPVEIIGGKVPQLVIHTDMVWDGDVNPEGLSAAYKIKLGSTASLFATGLSFIIDESITGPDSRMIGGQIGGDAAVNQALKFGASVAYYDYSLKTIAGADAGDVRLNRFANGRYLSDFNLLDIIGSANWTGLGARWPLHITANYVHNLGATTDADTEILLTASAGRLAKPGDWRISYGVCANRHRCCLCRV